MKIVCLGDSLTYGYRDITHYPEILNTYPKLDVVNGGKSWANVPETIKQAYRLIPQNKPQIVTIMIGLNDLRFNGYKPEVIFKQLEQLINFIRDYKAIPLLSTLPYICCQTSEEDVNAIRKYIEKLNVLLNAFAQLHNVELVDNYSITQNENLFHSDGFHLNNEGHKVVASNFYKFIQRYKD